MAESSERGKGNVAAIVAQSNDVQRAGRGSDLDPYRAARSAASSLRLFTLETPLVLSPALSEHTGAEVFLKLENRQHTGSFKLRGATHKLRSLVLMEQARGVVTASTGNHALAVAHAAEQLNVAATIYLPEDASQSKVEKLRAYPAALRRVAGDALAAENSARRSARRRGLVYVSPYNDPQIIAGQGTIAVEMLRQEPELDAVFATVGGGGLMGGIAGYLKGCDRAVQTFGCQPERSAAMMNSVRAGRVVEIESLPTLSDGSAGGIEENAVTFDLCRDYVDTWLTVSEEEIAGAMRLVYRDSGERIEGAAGVAVAGLLQQRKRLAGRRLAVVICGGNVDDEVWRQVVEAEI